MVDPPKQLIDPAVEEALTAEGSLIVIEVVAVQPVASVTVKVYEPAVRVKLPVPEYGVVPPLALTVTVVEPPLQAILPEEEDAVSGLMVRLSNSVTHPTVCE